MISENQSISWSIDLFLQNLHQILNHYVKRASQPVQVGKINGCHALTLGVVSDGAITNARSIGNFLKCPAVLGSKLPNPQPHQAFAHTYLTNDNLLSFNIRYLKKRSPLVWTTKGDRLLNLMWTDTLCPAHLQQKDVHTYNQEMRLL
ncbi:hypothetical protein [Microcoleus sp. AT13-A5]